MKSHRHPRLLLLPLGLLASATLALPAADEKPSAVVPAPIADKPAASAKLAVGSDAPALKPEKWLKGEPVAAFAKDKVYLIECWATWCGPCLAAIPHLNVLHARYADKGLVVVGVNVWDPAEAKAEDLVARKGDKMAYRVALDGKSGNVAGDWLKAAGITGIPHAFLVREGKIVWMGSPYELTDAGVQSALAGGAVAVAEPSPADRARLVEYRNARNEILGLLRAGEADKALAKVSEREAILAGIDAADPELLRGMALSVKGDKDASLACYRRAAKAAKDDAGALFRVALGLMDHGSVRDNALALECARAAVAKDDIPIFRHMLARTEAASGNKAAAIAILERLVAEEDDEAYRAELRALKGGETPQAPSPRQQRR